MIVESRLCASIHFSLDNQDNCLLTIKGLNLTDIDHIKEMCKNKQKTILYLKDAKLEKLAQFIMKNISENSLKIIDSTDEIQNNMTYTASSNGIYVLYIDDNTSNSYSNFGVRSNNYITITTGDCYLSDTFLMDINYTNTIFTIKETK